MDPEVPYAGPGRPVERRGSGRDDCCHIPDPTSIELDCKPTAEWVALCDACGAVLAIQTDGDRPDDLTDGWEAINR